MKRLIKIIGEVIVNIIKAIKCNCKSGCCESNCNQRDEEIEQRIQENEKQIEANRQNILDAASYI